MRIKATILCENCVYDKIEALAEHGWAVYLETDQGNFLFDTGQGNTIINNARSFDKDLSKIKGIIISHHHVDHTGGLLEVLKQIHKVKVYSHPELFKNSFEIVNGEVEGHIGIPYRRQVLESKGAEFIFNREPLEIAPSLILSGEIPRKTSFEKGDKNLVTKNKNGYTQDPILDDQTLIVETNKGLFIILGCSHAGIINILNYATKITGQEHIHAIIGGTHLGPVKKEIREKSIQTLKEFEIDKIGVSHCTGLETSIRLKQEFGKSFFFCNVGSEIEI